MWNDDIFYEKKGKLKEPTDEQLQKLEEDMNDIISGSLTVVEDFGLDKGEYINNPSLSSPQFLTNSELEMINEMCLIVSDPNYISDVRKKRLQRKEERLNNFSFEGYNEFSGDYDNDY